MDSESTVFSVDMASDQFWPAFMDLVYELESRQFCNKLTDDDAETRPNQEIPGPEGLKPTLWNLKSLAAPRPTFAENMETEETEPAKSFR
jgi:hypothetical protein